MRRVNYGGGYRLLVPFRLVIANRISLRCGWLWHFERRVVIRLVRLRRLVHVRGGLLLRRG